MSDDKKLNLPVVRKADGLRKGTGKGKLQLLDLAKKTALRKASESTVSAKEAMIREEQGLDLVLVGDLTVSMTHYHRLLKQKFRELAKNLFPLIHNLRIGIIFYLDHGSDNPYVTKVCQITDDVNALQSFIDEAQTGNIGDVDEAVEDALYDLIYLDWRKSKNNSVVLFGDARPHERNKCPEGHDYFRLVRRLHRKGVIVNSVYCGENKYSDEELQQLENTAVGDFSKRVSYLDHPNFFSWIANVTGGMTINVQQIDDLMDIILASAAKDSGNLDEYEDSLKSTTSRRKLNLIHVAKKAKKRHIAAQESRLLGR